MAALWIREPDSPMFKSWGAGENGYRALFAKYDLKAMVKPAAELGAGARGSRR